MPLNYSKWDQLELSDDSDIEGHPNVDKRSLIRWKQRDIHEKREARKHRIEHLRAQIECNHVLLPRIEEIAGKLADAWLGQQRPTVYFSGVVERLEAQPSRDCPPGNDPDKLEQTYDGMLLSLLKKVSEEAKEKVAVDGVGEEERDEKIGLDLAARMKTHVKQLGERIDEDKKELENEIGEQKKHITSEDLHEGFENKYVPPKPAPVSLGGGREKKKEKAREYETLNPQGVAAAASLPAPTQKAGDEADDEEEEEEEIPDLTPSLEAFSKLAIWAYDKSLEFIQNHRDVFVPGASDALLVAAFRAEQAGEKKYAKQCVHQSLLLQYCEKLGSDGVRVFFNRMVQANTQAKRVFEEDVEKTYKHLEQRVKITMEETPEAQEQIQLVAEGGEQGVTFNVPDGPPPEELRLEGPGTEKYNVEEVRKALQFRWDVFQGFSDDMQEALKSGELVRVNKVLAGMDVPSAEQVVQSLDMAGILGFAEGGIRDETGKTDPSCRILTVSASLDSALAFIKRVRGGWESELAEATEIPWTISNKYYSANVHFVAHTVRELNPNLIRDVPAMVFVWTKGEAYRDDVERLAQDMQAYEPEVLLGVRMDGQDEEDGEIDDFLSSHGFEYVSVTDEGRTTTQGNHYSMLATVPDFPRVIDALSSIMWPSMMSGGDLDVWGGDSEARRSESPSMGFSDDFNTTGSYGCLESEDEEEVAATHARLFGSEDVIGELEAMRREIAGMEDSEERRRAAELVALGVVYGL
ncbi:hypothetical protein APHAL10511_002722 [Amanita phalloides]|nr:hypothetical protein APHAL10511_002722 [Amanita phalloides]